MNQRRTSGEIINATLLEVFLAFVFVVLALAVFEGQQADMNAEAASSARAKEGALIHERDSARSGMVSAGHSRDSIQAFYRSQFPPTCDGGVPIAVVSLANPDRWIVTATRRTRSLLGDTARLVRRQAFLTRFDSIIAMERSNGCRYVVQVLDNGGIDKSAFKEAMRVIQHEFYATGQYARTR